jgi:hypothetical protein
MVDSTEHSSSFSSIFLQDLKSFYFLFARHHLDPLWPFDVAIDTCHALFELFVH